MNNDNPRPRHLHQPTSQRADLHANESSALAAPQHPNGPKSGVSGRLGTNNGPGKPFAAVDPFGPLPSTDLGALSHVKEHIDEGKTRTDWNVTHQIEGLLLHILPDWYEVCRQTFDCPFDDWPRLGWTPEIAAAFVSELEQPIARARLRPLLQELLLAGLGPAPSWMSGDRVVSDYSQAQLHSSGYCNQPTQGPPAPLLDSDCCTNDSPINATGDLDNLFPPLEPSDSSFSQPHNAGEQDLLLGAAGSQFPQSPTRVGTYYANADILPSETDQDTITDVGLRNGALYPDPLTTSSWIADQQFMRRPGNGLLENFFAVLPEAWSSMPTNGH
ncbi:hypothetical protein KC351_g15671 [Hortaea werneckii]|nr:hypothetical protein KC351_g15671 [Hortaea werneckii]